MTVQAGNERARNEAQFAERVFLIFGVVGGIVLGELDPGVCWWFVLLLVVVVLAMTIAAIRKEHR